MQKYNLYSFFIIALFGCCINFAYPQNIDSLQKIYNNKKLPDTVRLQALDDIIWNQLFINPDSAYKLALTELDFAKKTKAKKFIPIAYQNLGGCYFYRADYKNAEKYYKQSLKKFIELNYQNGIASVHNNLGIVYEVTYQYNKAVDEYLKSIAISEKKKDYKELSKTFTNIGNIYTEINEYKYAFDYFNKSINYCKKANDIVGIAETYNNMAVLYHQMGNYDSSIAMNRFSIKICLEHNDLQCAATATNNLGMELLQQKQFDSALVYFEKSVELNKSFGDEFSMMRSKQNIGQIFLEKKQFLLAKNIFIDVLKYAQKIGGVDIVRDCYQGLYLVYTAEKNDKLALKFYSRFIALRDSLNTIGNEKELNRKKLEYEYHSKSFADSIKSESERKIMNAQLTNSETKKKYLYIVIIIILVFSFFLFNRFRKTRKQNSIIANQKLILEAKQKEILDSITYAKQLQNAILPSVSIWNNLVKESFILYLPKDIVAGDFYWIESIENIVLIAAADCTGHGVPGAMVSVVCSNALKRAVKEFHLTNPGLILNKARDLIIETFEKSEAEVKDGMDISLCAIDFDSKKMLWAGANNPLWIVKKCSTQQGFENKEIELKTKYKNSSYEIDEIKPDKQPVGKFANALPFKTNEIEITKGDMIYLFTDGLADQFGGTNKNTRGKKLKTPAIKNTLLQIQDLSMKDQKNELLRLFHEWKGDLEQIDDICIIGVKIQ